MTNQDYGRNTGEQNSFSISVFFPCYNEESNLRNVIGNAVDVLSQINADYELIIVNDGSSDKTGSIAQQLVDENARIKLVNHEVNQGYGSALKSGFLKATKEFVFYTDGDGQFDIKELPPLLPLMKDYDVVSCYRQNRQDSFVRKINAWCWTRLVCFVFGMKIKDVDCAFKLYKRKIFDEIEICSTGALIDAEILARITRKGYKITQAPVTHYPRVAGEQTGAKLSVILRAFKELFVLRRKIYRS